MAGKELKNVEDQVKLELSKYNLQYNIASHVLADVILCREKLPDLPIVEFVTKKGISKQGRLLFTYSQTLPYNSPELLKMLPYSLYMPNGISVPINRILTGVGTLPVTAITTRLSNLRGLNITPTMDIITSKLKNKQFYFVRKEHVADSKHYGQEIIYPVTYGKISNIVTDVTPSDFSMLSDEKKLKAHFVISILILDSPPDKNEYAINFI